MERTAKKEIKENTTKHLENIAYNTYMTCPALTRFYLLKKKAIDQINDSQHGQRNRYSHCPYCSASYLPGFHKTRLIPKMKLSGRIKRLLKKHTESPGSLGKFQQKLVSDYVTGRNTLAVKCCICEKTVKLPGQTRQARHKQIQIAAENDVSDVPEVPKTRKEKLKEKKKKLKKKKKAQLGNDDPNAGLTISNRSSAVPEDNECDVGTSKEEDGNQLLVVKSTVSSPLSIQKTGLDSVQDRQFSTNQMTVDNITYRNKGSASNMISKLKDAQKGVNLKQTGATGQRFSSDRKNKVKNLHQQLGNILKQEKNKTTGGNLADFLSSL